MVVVVVVVVVVVAHYDWMIPLTEQKASYAANILMP